MVKVFGIGNILLKDDGIGVRLARNIKRRVDKDNINEIEFFIGETDYLYCLENINDDEFIIILDSTYFGINPGEITFKKLEECDKLISKEITAHETSLLSLVRLEKTNVNGYFIGIEIDSIEYSLELSNILQKRFNSIYDEVYEFIVKIAKELYFL